MQVPLKLGDRVRDQYWKSFLGIVIVLFLFVRKWTIQTTQKLCESPISSQDNRCQVTRNAYDYATSSFSGAATEGNENKITFGLEKSVSFKRLTIC